MMKAKKKFEGGLKFLHNKCSKYVIDLFFLSKMSSEESGECQPWGICYSSIWGRNPCGVALRTLVGFLQLSCWGRTWAAQAFLKNVGICWLYPLVIVLFCLNDLKAKFLVEVNCRLIADLHMTVKT